LRSFRHFIIGLPEQPKNDICRNPDCRRHENQYQELAHGRRSNDVGFIAKLFAALGMRNNRIRWRKDATL
jgi:hypothetical protein